MQKKKVMYYQDPSTDDFGPELKKVKKITRDYKYRRSSFLYIIISFIVYRLIMMPIAFIYTKGIRRIKIYNKSLLKKSKKEGIIIYANHTHAVSDAFAPNIALWPRNVSMVTNAANVSLPVLGKITPSLGALPLPEDYKASKNFVSEIERRLKKKHALLIYPEAKLWPYYTKIRPFGNESFSYAYKFNTPVYTLTTVYKTSKRNKLKTVLYIDGPFYIDLTLDKKEGITVLRDQVYNAMSERSVESTFTKIRYVPSETL